MLFWRVNLYCVQIYTLLTTDHLYNLNDLIVLLKLCVIQSYFTLGVYVSTLCSLLVFISPAGAFLIMSELPQNLEEWT